MNKRGFAGSFPKQRNKGAQQEMVGFVLIIVLVVVGMMVFLVLSLREPAVQEDSLDVKNMLDAVMDYTTDCAIVFEPQFDTIEDLFKSAYQGQRCTNRGVMARDYLNDTLSEILEELSKSETSIAGYTLYFVNREEGSEEELLQVNVGECSSSTQTSAAQRNILSGGDTLIVRLEACSRALGSS